MSWTSGIFRLQCPKCEQTWYAEESMRGTEHKAICPYCSHEFALEESLEKTFT